MGIAIFDHADERIAPTDQSRERSVGAGFWVMRYRVANNASYALNADAINHARWIHGIIRNHPLLIPFINPLLGPIQLLLKFF
jgi:hypothetical protein